jgi:transposase
MEKNLQTIIGVDKNNPHFTVYRDTKRKEILVYMGMALMETIPETGENNPQLKLLLARLFNANVKKSKLIEHFGHSYHTLKRWGDALKSGDPDILVQALGGQGTHKKLTKEIEGYISHRFASIYSTNKYTYSSELRTEIKKVFQLEISPETLRPLFNKLKEQYYQSKQCVEKKTL